jgi:hypothetical protein
LIYFDPFYFKNGGESKPKYFLVLKVIDGNAVLVSLPSSINHLPQGQPIVHGCLEIPDICINCYIFEANRPITKEGWAFPMDTLLYGNWLDDYSIESLKEKYSIEGVEYEIKGELTDDELKKVINCFAASSVVKRRFKRILAA